MCQENVKRWEWREIRELCLSDIVGIKVILDAGMTSDWAYFR